MKVRIAGMGFALCALACQEDRDNPGGLRSEVRDSAGIVIVENARPPDGSRLGWRIGPEPAVSIGVFEGDEAYMLYEAVDATRLSDGRIVLANAGTDDLRVFDGAGRHLATWGREGDGPTDFASLVRVGAWPGDSIVAWYAGSVGIAVHDAQGRRGRTFFLRSQQAVNWLRARPVDARADGLVLSTRPVEAPDSAIVEIWDADGVLAASTGTHPEDNEFITTGERGRPLRAQLAYGRQLVTGLWGNLFVVSPTSRYEIRAFSTDGTLARMVRRDHVPRAPTEADREPFVEAQMVHILASPDLPDPIVQEARRHFSGVPLAEFFPAFSSVRGDAVGHLWVEEYRFPFGDRAGTLWTVFDPEGRVLGFVETPEGLEVYEIGADYLLGRAKDELGVERIQLWPLERSGLS